MEKEALFLDREIDEDTSWSFKELKRKETSYASHGYHKYPAKFIPQLVKKLLERYSNAGDLVLDPFGGCGTTLVESKINGRNSICIDVNDSALLISSAKKTAINPEILKEENNKLLSKINNIKLKNNFYIGANERLKYWFDEDQFNELTKIFQAIQSIENRNLRIFYNCCFSNILKNCSRWYSKSIKPMIDPNKKIAEPLDTFKKHLEFMTRQNSEFYWILKERNHAGIKSIVKRADARKTNLESNSIDLIITSPPYATSYEYADIHQLSLLWFGFTDKITHVRQEYMGSSSKRELPKNQLDSGIANEIINKLSKINKNLSNQISNYISDLERTYLEMYRVLKSGKRTCIIMGNTEYKGVKILNTEISVDILKKIGFKIDNIIKRKLSSKNFTPYRGMDGRFSNKTKGRQRKIYQYEYIIVAKKDSKV